MSGRMLTAKDVEAIAEATARRLREMVGVLKRRRSG
jgi:hypothetical protein